MSWTKNILAHLGMVSPYDFPRAILALLMSTAIIFVVVLAAYWWTKENLLFNSPRTYFLSYLMVLIGGISIYDKSDEDLSTLFAGCLFGIRAIIR